MFYRRSIELYGDSYMNFMDYNQQDYMETLYRKSIRYYGDSVNLFGSFIFYCYLCNIERLQSITSKGYI